MTGLTRIPHSFLNDEVHAIITRFLAWVDVLPSGVASECRALCVRLTEEGNHPADIIAFALAKYADVAPLSIDQLLFDAGVDVEAALYFDQLTVTDDYSM